jgi:hypothetical protein
MDIESVKIISYNPYFCNNLIPFFINGLEKKECQISLVYLLFPMVLHRDSREKLSKANSRSSIFTLFSDNEYAGIEYRVEDFETLTNQSLILATNRHYLKIDNDKIKLRKSIKVDHLTEKDKLIRQYYKASFEFGRILNGHSIIDIFIKLGIRKL